MRGSPKKIFSGFVPVRIRENQRRAKKIFNASMVVPVNPKVGLRFTNKPSQIVAITGDLPRSEA